MTDLAPAPRLATGDVEAHQQFVDLVAEVRPELFRYCARMTGSLFDGEDVVQETLARAYAAMPQEEGAPPLRPWLFRIAHNAALDFLKRYERKHVDLVADPPELLPEDEGGFDTTLVDAALTRCLELPPLQRGALVLKDVLGHSLSETAATLGTTVPAVKAALVRARASLSRRAPLAEPSRAEPASLEDLRNLRRYAELFNRRDWDSLRALMTEESRLDVVSRARRRGLAVAEYYGRYSEIAPVEDLRAEAGYFDGQAVIALFRPASSPTPAYFVLIDWSGEQVQLIRDFRYVPYLAESGAFTPSPR